MSRPLLACAVLAATGCPAPDAEEESFLPTPVATDGLNGSEDLRVVGLQLCVHGESVYLLWMDDRLAEGTDRLDLFMNVSQAGGRAGSWLDAPLRVNSGPGWGSVFNPQLACSEAGGFVVWEDDRDGSLANHQIYFNGTVDGLSTLGPDRLLELDADGLSMSIEPRIAADGDTLTVAWMDSDAGTFDIFVTTSTDAGGDWSRPLRLDPGKPGSAFSARPDVAVADGGQRAWVAYEDVLDGVMLARTEDAGQTFWSPVSLAMPEVSSPRLCSVGDDEVYVLWYQRLQDRRELLVRHSDDGGLSFQAGAVALPTASSNAVTFDPPCRAHGDEAVVAWFDDRGGDWDAVYAPLAGGEVGAAVSLPLEATGLGLPATDFDVRDGTVAVLYDNGFKPGVHYVFRTEAGLLSGPYRIDDRQTQEVVDVRLALLGDDLWLAAWTGATEDRFGVFVQRGALGDEAAPLR
ncbi:MAG: glycoside hydrolase [Myxococcales bacterium]|nr:glycoside hydrolase [Myxococcales bacterium]